MDVVVKILGVGLSGFGFLLMYLAYKLIAQVIVAKNPQTNVLPTINRYMLVCFIMTVTVGIFTFISTEYKEKAIESLSATVDDEKRKNDLFTTVRRGSVLADSIIISKNTESTVVEIKEDYRKVLDTLSTFITSANDTAIKREFQVYKTSLIRISDSLQMGNLSRPKVDSLKTRFVLYNNSLSNLSVQAAMNKSN